jgi:hypothetical protein
MAPRSAVPAFCLVAAACDQRVILPGSVHDRERRNHGVARVASSGSIPFRPLHRIRGGVNTTDRPRRAVNHVYSIPLLRQQIDLPEALGETFAADSKLRKLLGYDVRTPRSVAEYLASRARKL